MRDPRLVKLAENLTGYSVRVQPGDNVLIDMIGTERELAKCLVEEVAKRGGHPFVEPLNRNFVDVQVGHHFRQCDV